MTAYQIEIEGLPEGWRPVAYRKPVFGEYYFYNDGIQQGKTGSGQFLIVEKIPPRRIVLEETEEDNSYDSINRVYVAQWLGDICLKNKEKIWREVKDE